MAADLATPADLANPPDLATPLDLADPLDLATPLDFANPLDLATPVPDLTVVQLSIDYFLSITVSAKPLPITVRVSPQTSTTVTLSVVSGPGTMSGTVSAATDNGAASLTPSFDRAGVYVLAASAPSATTIRTPPFRVAGSPQWTVQPTSAAGGAAMSPTPVVTLVDSTGAVDTTDGDRVRIRVANDSPCPPSVGQSFEVVQGVATMDGFAVRTACAGYRLLAEVDWNADPAESAPFDIAVGPPSQWQLRPDSPLLVDKTFSVQASVVDAGGNLVEVGSTDCTLSLAGATLSGTITQTTAGGVASFAGLSIDRAGVQLPLTASGGGWSGQTWIDVSAWERRGSPQFGSLAVDPANPDVLYASGEGTSVLGSLDAGATFAEIGFLPAGLYGRVVLDPLATSTLYIGGSTGLFRSDDSGANWSLNGSGLPSDLRKASVAVDPLDGQVYLLVGGQLWRSSDAGAHFATVSPALANLSAFAIDPASSTVWSGATGAVFISSDEGASWIDRTGNLPTTCVAASMIVSPTNGNNVYVSCGSASGFVTTDGGGSWIALSSVPYADSIAIDAGGTWYGFGGVTDKLWKSADGQSWRTVRVPYALSYPVVVPGHPGWLYASDPSFLYRTTSGGE